MLAPFSRSPSGSQKEFLGGNMKKIWLGLLFAILFALPAMAGDFNSIYPPFGKSLNELGNASYFVKYLEKGVVSYYNYLGPREKDPIYEHSSPHMVYAFVDGKLYARISRNWDEDFSVISANMEKVFGEPAKRYEEGDWSVCQWNKLKGDDITLKVKYNKATSEVKTAHYYNPLRKLAQDQP
jgi:hypothetical protein